MTRWDELCRLAKLEVERQERSPWLLGRYINDEIGLAYKTAEAYAEVERFFRQAMQTPPQGGLAMIPFTAYRDAKGRFAGDAVAAVAYFVDLITREAPTKTGHWTRQAVLEALERDHPSDRPLTGTAPDGRSLAELEPPARAELIGEWLSDPETRAETGKNPKARSGVETAASEVQRALVARVRERSGERWEADENTHFRARLGQIRGELVSMNETLCERTTRDAIEETLGTAADRVLMAAQALAETVHAGAITDEDLRGLLGDGNESPD
jgi:hypothetical protein